MSDAVYRAMLSRGFHGEFRTINRFHSGPADYLWLAAVVGSGCVLVLAERGMVF